MFAIVDAFFDVSESDLRERADERRHDGLVELAAGAFAQFVRGLIARDRRLIRIRRRHRDPRVANLDDARRDRNRLTRHPARISAAVDALVMSQHSLRDVVAEERFDEGGADDGVLGETAHFFRREIRTFVQTVVIEQSQADVVNESGEAHGLDLRRRQFHGDRETLRHRRNLPRVIEQLRIFLKVGLEQFLRDELPVVASARCSDRAFD